MRNLNLTCCECGTIFTAKTDRALYCSNACRQKVYRIRSDEKKRAKVRTITMEQWSVFNALGNECEPIYNLVDNYLVNGKISEVAPFLDLMRNKTLVRELVHCGLIGLLAVHEGEVE